MTMSTACSRFSEPTARIIAPDRTGSAPRYELERVSADGVPVFLLHNPGDPNKAFADSYTNPRVEEAFRAVLAEWQPDAVHFTYLLWGLSVRMPAICRELGVPSVLTLTDYGLLCHRGQMFDWRLERCFGPHPPAACARCIREPSRFDGTLPWILARRLSVRVLAAVGGAGRVVTTSDLERRVSEHRLGIVEGFTKKYRLKRLIYCEETSDVQAALAR